MKPFLVIVAVIAIIGFKIYQLRKKSLKEVIKQKLVVVSVAAVIVGILYLSVPGFEFVNPKDIVVGYVSEFLEN